MKPAFKPVNRLGLYSRDMRYSTLIITSNPIRNVKNIGEQTNALLYDFIKPYSC
jgi:hypothetical protein